MRRVRSLNLWIWYFEAGDVLELATLELGVEIISSNEGDGIDWDEKLARYHELGVKEPLRFDPAEEAPMLDMRVSSRTSME